jgi:phosphate starvation-inducible PhoH-like protein
LPAHTRSGLLDALHRLRHIEGIKQVVLGKSDIVRHRLVQEIVQAYEDAARSNGVKKPRR